MNINDTYKDILRDRILTSEEIDELTDENLKEVLIECPYLIFSVSLLRVNLDLIETALVNGKSSLYFQVITSDDFTRKFTFAAMYERFSKYDKPLQ